MVKSLRKFLMGRQVTRSRGAPPAPVVEYTAPAPAVISSPEPVVEYGTPVTAVFQVPTPVVDFIAPVLVVFHAPGFPLSPDASDMSSPENVSWESLPLPIKSFKQVESAEPLNQASETPKVFHGRELPAGRRDGLVGHALWLRKEAALRGYAWRRQQRALQLSSLRAACVPPRGDVGEALRYAPSGAGVLVETLWELATRGKRTSASGKGSGEGAGARVAVRSVLEDHETAVLELERVVPSIEDRISELKHKVSGVCCDSEKRQLVVAELEGKFELFSAEVNFEFKSQWSGILNEVHGYYGDWLGECRKLEALLAWKEDFIPKLDEMVQDILELQNWVDAVDDDDGGGEADTENS